MPDLDHHGLQHRLEIVQARDGSWLADVGQESMSVMELLVSRAQRLFEQLFAG